MVAFARKLLRVEKVDSVKKLLILTVQCGLIYLYGYGVDIECNSGDAVRYGLFQCVDLSACYEPQMYLVKNSIRFRVFAIYISLPRIGIMSDSVAIEQLIIAIKRLNELNAIMYIVAV